MRRSKWQTSFTITCDAYVIFTVGLLLNYSAFFIRTILNVKHWFLWKISNNHHEERMLKIWNCMMTWKVRIPSLNILIEGKSWIDWFGSLKSYMISLKQHLTDNMLLWKQPLYMEAELDTESTEYFCVTYYI